MHPIVLHDLIKARTSALRSQAGREALSPAARRPQQASAKKSTPVMSADTTAELIRRVLTVLAARRPSQAP